MKKIFAALILSIFTSALFCGCTTVGRYYVFASESSSEKTTLDQSLTWYKNQLSNRQKIIYIQLDENTSNLQQGKPFTINTYQKGFYDDFPKAIKAYYLDHPECYWFKNNNSLYITDFDSTSAKIVPAYEKGYSNHQFSEEEIESTNKEIENVKNSIIEKANEFTSDAEKIRVIHDELLSLASYDFTLEYGYTIYDVVTYHLAVCDGYAKLFQYICQDIGIPCIRVIGNFDQNRGHAWNNVYIDGSWYGVDVTWDLSNDTNCISEPSPEEETVIIHAFLLRGSNFFNNAHSPIIEFKVPLLSYYDYDF